MQIKLYYDRRGGIAWFTKTVESIEEFCVETHKKQHKIHLGHPDKFHAIVEGLEALFGMNPKMQHVDQMVMCCKWEGVAF